MEEKRKRDTCSIPTLIPELKRPHKVRKELVQHEICGNIKQLSNERLERYWRAFGICPLPSATVTVLNSSHCKMTVKADLDGDGISEATLFILTEKDQSKSITIGSIAALEISCFSEKGAFLCSGRYSILLDYEKDCLGGEDTYV
ncbi:S-Ena type endospore appendage [Metabacillus malikii]|uniref:Endospore appendages core domain-containing protein n=1 Tax=Metabacillus malikii TaxID=1504265 RepID=A0ABT9ZCR8_9BACI|nr:S-Ena type endospore appendage [Metabacillus malikii]MDQ0229642.1 hypothetical protein [Metabacillus malikii]